MNKEQLLKDIENLKEITSRNSMGCSENWYNYVYAIKQTFTIEEIQSMNELEIEHLIKLAENISNGLY